MADVTAPAELAEPAPDTAQVAEPAPAADQQTDPATGSDTAGGAAAPAAPRFVLPKRLVFRIPGSAYVAIAFLAMCASFVAVAAPYFLLVYLLPLAAIIWVARTRTEVDAEQVVVRRVLSRTVIPWSRVASLRLAEKGWIRVVRTDGGEIALPTVRTRHLPALALISGGRITDPTATADQGPV